MNFELDAKGGCVDEGSPSLIHEAVDHVRNTWSKVLSGKASGQEYAEAAVEATAVVAFGALALKQGAKLFAARAGAAEGMVYRFGATEGIAARTDYLGRFAHAEQQAKAMYKYTPSNEMLSRMRDVAKGEISLGSKAPLGADGRPLVSGADAKSLVRPLFTEVPPKKIDAIAAARGASGAGIADAVKAHQAKFGPSATSFEDMLMNSSNPSGKAVRHNLEQFLKP